MVLLCKSSFAQYPKRLKVENTLRLEHRINEGSGLIFWDGKLITHNDSGPARLFVIDTLSGTTTDTFELPARINDWEEISQDSLHIYIADTGNNFGIRDTVKILRITKESLLLKAPVIDWIAFSWPRKHNHDCEAFIVTRDSILLFTKEKRQTQVFSIPKDPGNYVAKFRQRISTGIRVTGAMQPIGSNRLVLCGYNGWLKPHLLLFDDFDADRNLNQPRKIKLRQCMRQTEGIAVSGRMFYVINERFEFFIFRSYQELHKFKL